MERYKGLSEMTAAEQQEYQAEQLGRMGQLQRGLPEYIQDKIADRLIYMRMAWAAVLVLFITEAAGWLFRIFILA